MLMRNYRRLQTTALALSASALSRRLLCVLLLIGASVTSAAEGAIAIAPGFVTASKWRSLPSNARMLYVLGVIDGMKFSPILANGAHKTAKLADCTSRMDGEQILAIAQKHIEAKPDAWHEAAHYRIFEAFAETCRLFK